MVDELRFYRGGGGGQYWLMDDFTYNETQTAVPEPATMLLLGFGLMGLGVARKRFKTI